VKPYTLALDGFLALCLAVGAAGCQSRPSPASASHARPTGTPRSKKGGSPSPSSNGRSGNSGSTSEVDGVWEREQTDPPLANHPTNGCEPYGSTLDGFCITTYPVWSQSSTAMSLWSGVQVGATVEIKGATLVSAKTLKPYFSSMEITGPGGFTATLPVAPDGGYDGNVTFARAGKYQIGGVMNGERQEPLQFDVSYVPRPEASATLADVFPDSQRQLPHDVVVVYPAGATTSVPVLFTDMAGHPAANVQIPVLAVAKPTTVTTNDQGVATVPLSISGAFNPAIAYLNRLYGALFSLQYWTAEVSGGVVTQWPRFAAIHPAPTLNPQTIVQDGVAYYQASVALGRLDPLHAAVTISQDGTVSAAQLVCWQSCNYVPAHPMARVQPIVRDGTVYLDVPDLVEVLNTVAWASLSPTGQLRVADFVEP